MQLQRLSKSCSSKDGGGIEIVSRGSGGVDDGDPLGAND